MSDFISTREHIHIVSELDDTLSLLIDVATEVMPEILDECASDSRQERFDQVEELRDAAERVVKLLDRYIASAEYE